MIAARHRSRPSGVRAGLCASALFLSLVFATPPFLVAQETPSSTAATASTSASASASASATAEPPIRLSEMAVYGRGVDLVGEAASASQGEVGEAELAARPFLRRGELLEVVPGVVITQHSGSGKANQYFLRGFNLDHGTDFAVSVDGMPVNMRSHAHGQGYADLNFIIPELLAGVDYQKGAFFAANGDFSAAGAAQFHLAEQLDASFAKIEFGADDYARFVAGATIPNAENAATTIGAEASYYDGPWVLPEHGTRFNALARHTWVSGENRFTLTALGYRGDWDSTDQVPQRAIESGAISRFGFIDPTDGGDSDRASLSFDWTAKHGDATTRLNAYGIAYRLNLFSNFTYFLDDPINGDQFNQRDRRSVFGGSLEHTWSAQLGGVRLENTAGVQARQDFIDLGLLHTAARREIGAIRRDDVNESSAAVFVSSTLHLGERFRATAGMRGDFFRFDVQSDNALNSGTTTAGIGSPKLSFVFGPWAKTEAYLSGGFGFHSNDARGVVARVNPADGSAIDRADPLARARNVEVGMRTAVLPGLVSTVSLWALDLDSELVFVGDAGNTEATGRSRRYGVELANFYQARPWLAFDADVAFTRARYRDATSEDRIANSISAVVTGGVTVNFAEGFFGSVRGRYFGPQPLIEDNSVSIASSFTCNARVGWRTKNWEIAADLLNVFDRANNDIAYFYTSRLPGEPAEGVDDIHLHPAEPRMLRVSVGRKF